MTDCPSILTLGQLKANDLKGEAKTSVVQHTDHCKACQTRLAELDSNISTFNSNKQSHLDNLMRIIEKEDKRLEAVKKEQKAKKGASLFGSLTAMAAAVAAVVVFSLMSPHKNTGNDETTIQFKGNVSVQVVAKRGENQFTVSDGTVLFDGDALRFIVTTATSGFLHVFSIDSQGQVSPFYPESDPHSDPDPMALDSSGRHELPGSVILDDSVGVERFVVVFSDETFDRAKLLDLMMSKGEKDPEDKPFKGKIDIQILSINKQAKPVQ